MTRFAVPDVELSRKEGLHQDVSIYFLVAPDFCDHLLFFQDGTFEHGSSFAWGSTCGRGEWSLFRASSNRASHLMLRLRWLLAQEGASAQFEESFTSAEIGGNRRFSANFGVLQHVG